VIEKKGQRIAPLLVGHPKICLLLAQACFLGSSLFIQTRHNVQKKNTKL
jgi:hypothetical protein